ncbi:hypothetical protein VNI00_011525 [Paramarasmius palmivorus]|uniref:Uncharacterized protein n=1 Tax=Paramarasmius palmivorus TaxID=297713 RepID=A0AAW0CC06_9AGAR
MSELSKQECPLLKKGTLSQVPEDKEQIGYLEYSDATPYTCAKKWTTTIHNDPPRQNPNLQQKKATGVKKRLQRPNRKPTARPASINTAPLPQQQAAKTHIAGMQTGRTSDDTQPHPKLTIILATASTRIAGQLNTLSYIQQQAVRALVEMIILTGTPETVYEILEATTFMADLAREGEDSDTTDAAVSSDNDGSEMSCSEDEQDEASEAGEGQ